MNLDYFQKINNTYKSESRQETDLFLLNRHFDECFSDTIDYHVVKRNGEPFELIIIKDTDGNTFKKKIKSKHSSPFNLGDYIEWNNQIWLVTLLDPNEKTYHSGYMYLCTVPLRWINSDGELVERYSYSEDFTKYSTGVTGNNTVQIAENQYGLTLPIDSQTKQLKRDMRFAIDFDDATQPDIYALTNRKVNLNNNEYFGRGGTMIVTMSYDSFNKDVDKQITLPNGKKIWICDYTKPSISTNLPDISSDSSQEQNSLKCNIEGSEFVRCGSARTYSAIFSDKDGNSVECKDFVWNIISNFDIESKMVNDNLFIYVEDDGLIDEKFKLQVLVNDVVMDEKIITISGVF